MTIHEKTAGVLAIGWLAYALVKASLEIGGF